MESVSSTPVALPPPPPQAQMLPPGGQIEIVFSFDTTGSMSECLDQVRAQLRHIIERLFADIPGLRIAVFAHGDYCDLDIYGYVTKHVDFTNDIAALCRFVEEVEGTGGGDFEECYELVLRQVREQLSWQPGSQRALVMIGDATPHEKDSDQNVQGIDWRQEVSRLKNTHIYAVQCLDNHEADSFYRHLAETTGGRHLKLDELTNIVDIMMAICYREKGAEFFEDFEQEVRQRDGAAMRADLDRMFIALKDQPIIAGTSDSSAAHGGTSNLTPIPMSDVTEEVRNSESEANDYMLRPMSTSFSEIDDPDEAEASSGSIMGIANSSDSSIITASTPTRLRAGSVSSDGLSMTSGRSSRTSGSAGSQGSHRRRSSGVMTRSRAHPMTLRQRNPLRQTLRDRRHRKSKQTPSQRCLERALRECQDGNQFVLSDLSWSRWQQAMTTTPPHTPAWERRPGDRPGHRKRQLYNDMTSPAVYEFAVQTPNSTVKTPVLGSVTNGCRERGHLEGALLSRPLVRTRVNDVLQKGCKLYVRRAHVTPRDLPSVKKRCGIKSKDGTSSDDESMPTSASAVCELRRLMGRVCDYAWRPRCYTQTGNATPRRYMQRPLRRKGISISSQR